MNKGIASVAIADSVFSQNAFMARTILTWAKQMFESLDSLFLEGGMWRLLETVKSVAKMDCPFALGLVDRIEEPDRDSALFNVVEATASVDAYRAEGIAHHITDRGRRAYALAICARAVAPHDRKETDRLLTTAERIARTAGPTYGEDLDALSDITHDAAQYDADAAESILFETYGDPSDRDFDLKILVGIVAEYDPDRAELLADTIEHPEFRSRALISVAKAYAKG